MLGMALPDPLLIYARNLKDLPGTPARRVERSGGTLRRAAWAEYDG